MEGKTKNLIATIAMAVSLPLTGCTVAPTPTAPAAALAAAPVVHVKATAGQQEAFASQLRGLIMDNLGLEMHVEATDRDAPKEVVRPDGYAVLVIRLDSMSEPLARQMLHAGLLAKAQQMDFVTVRFENAGPFEHARIWIYNTTDSQAWAGWRRCETNYKLVEKYSHMTQAQLAAAPMATTCTYKLEEGLPL